LLISKWIYISNWSKWIYIPKYISFYRSIYRLSSWWGRARSNDVNTYITCVASLGGSSPNSVVGDLGSNPETHLQIYALGMLMRRVLILLLCWNVFIRLTIYVFIILGNWYLIFSYPSIFLSGLELFFYPLFNFWKSLDFVFIAQDSTYYSIWFGLALITGLFFISPYRSPWLLQSIHRWISIS
jgi:hypothetical protein